MQVQYVLLPMVDIIAPLCPDSFMTSVLYRLVTYLLVLSSDRVVVVINDCFK